MITFNPFLQSAPLRFRLPFSGALAAILLLFGFSAQAQPSFYNSSGGTSYNSFPLASSTNKVQWIYAPGVFNSAGATGTPTRAGLITKVYFRLGTTVSSTATYSDFTISMAQNQGTASVWSSATFVTGLTRVFYSASYTTSGASATSWYGVTLNTPFPYDPTQSLVFELKVSAGTGNQVAQTTSGGNQRNYGTYSGTTGTLNSGLVDFGFDIKNSKNDLSAIGIVGLTNSCGATADPVIVQIKNTGIVDIASGQNIPVRTVVSGGGTATLTRAYNKALKVGSTDTIHVGNLNTTAITGSINLKSSISYSEDSVQVNDTNLTSKTFLGPSKPTPDFKITLVCDTVKFTNQTKDICNRATGYKWDFDNGKTSSAYSPNFSYNSPGTYNVKLYVFYGAGLKDSVTKQVIVYAKPQANFSASNQCFGVAIDFSNFSFGVASYKWSFGDGGNSTATSPSRTYATAGTFAVKLVATSPNNCKDSITKNVTVYSKPVASFSVSNACAGANAYVNNSSTGGSTFNWDLGDGTSSNYYNPGKVYSVPGTYGITLTVFSAQGCSDNTSRTVTIYTLPVSSFNVQNNCWKVATSFTNNSTGANSNLWSFGDATASNSLSPSKTYVSPGTYNVTLTVTSANGCTHASTKPVSIFALPQANFSVNDVCFGIPTDFTNLSQMPSGGGDYIWRFGDGNASTQVNPSYKYSSAGGFDVHLLAISSNGCKDSALLRVNVFDKPKATFTAADVCDGQAAKFINNSTGTTTQSWDFGDGAKDNNFSPNHTYAGPNFYKVVLTVSSSNNCKEVYEGSVTVKPNPELVFSVSDHCHGSTATFTNLSVGAASFTWKFGDGDSSKTGQASHLYANPGTYPVKLRGTSAKGCMVEQTKSLKVFPRPVPAFSATTVCHGLSTQFTNASTGATAYNWTFGDGSGNSTASNPSYLYMNAGTFKVLLTAISSDNCREDLTKTITVAPLPIPIFLVQDVCTGIEVKPSNASQGVITSQKWNFSDGYTDTAKSPSHAYASPGIYTIKLIVSTGLGCSDSTSKTILIYTRPLIKISGNITVSKGYSAQLLASGGTDYLWSPAATLDNPAVPNPKATPGQETRYTVSVSNAFGCLDTASVLVSLAEDFTLEPQNFLSPNANGKNDLWKIKGIEFYPLAKVMVFDQWGRILFTQENYQNTWDGTMSGKPLPDGTYYYVITLPGNERQYKGTLIILKN